VVGDLRDVHKAPFAVFKLNKSAETVMPTTFPSTMLSISTMNLKLSSLFTN
jgi:hypothetical protein